METERRDRAAVRIMLIAIGLVLATVVAVELVLRVERVLVWMVIAVFFTTALPVVFSRTVKLNPLRPITQLTAGDGSVAATPQTSS